MAYPIQFIVDIFSPSKTHEDLSKNSYDARGALIMDVALSILVLVTAGCALGHVGYLANLSEIAAISMTAAASGVILVDMVLFTLRKANSETVEDEPTEPQPATKTPRARIELPQQIASNPDQNENPDPLSEEEQSSKVDSTIPPMTQTTQTTNLHIAAALIFLSFQAAQMQKTNAAEALTLIHGASDSVLSSVVKESNFSLPIDDSAAIYRTETE